AYRARSRLVPSQALDPAVRSVARGDVGVAYDTDRAVGLEHREQHVIGPRHAVLPERLQHLVARDAGATAMLVEDLAVVDQHDPLARDQLGEPAAPEPGRVDQPVP